MPADRILVKDGNFGYQYGSSLQDLRGAGAVSGDMEAADRKLEIVGAFIVDTIKESGSIRIWGPQTNIVIG